MSNNFINHFKVMHLELFYQFTVVLLNRYSSKVVSKMLWCFNIKTAQIGRFFIVKYFSTNLSPHLTFRSNSKAQAELSFR